MYNRQQKRCRPIGSWCRQPLLLANSCVRKDKADNRRHQRVTRSPQRTCQAPRNRNNDLQLGRTRKYQLQSCYSDHQHKQRCRQVWQKGRSSQQGSQSKLLPQVPKPYLMDKLMLTLLLLRHILYLQGIDHNVLAQLSFREPPSPLGRSELRHTVMEQSWWPE